MSTPTSAGHVPVDTLLAWWLHETDAAQTQAVDAHLMHCDACGSAVDALAALGDSVRAAFKAGLVGTVTTGDFIARLTSRGVRVRAYRLVANGGVDCTVAPDDELLVSHVQAPLAGSSGSTSSPSSRSRLACGIASTTSRSTPSQARCRICRRSPKRRRVFRGAYDADRP